MIGQGLKGSLSSSYLLSKLRGKATHGNQENNRLLVAQISKLRCIGKLILTFVCFVPLSSTNRTRLSTGSFNSLFEWFSPLNKFSVISQWLLDERVSRNTLNHQSNDYRIFKFNQWSLGPYSVPYSMLSPIMVNKTDNAAFLLLTYSLVGDK